MDRQINCLTLFLFYFKCSETPFKPNCTPEYLIDLKKKISILGYKGLVVLNKTVFVLTHKLKSQLQNK